MTDDKSKKKEAAIDWSKVKNVAGTNDPHALEKYVREIMNSMFFFEGQSTDDIIEKLNSCLSILQSIQPQDQMETLLVVQMMTTHNTSMECLRRANISNQTFEGRTMALNQAAKFLRLYMDQLNTLNRHRGKGQQNLIVGQVNVESGGQAIVGNVAKDTQEQPAPIPTLTHDLIEPMGMGTSRKKEKVTVKRTRK